MEATQGTNLSIQDLSKTFGTKPVLQGINLAAKPGEFIALVGRSGCGKSTLLRLVAGLETPTDGGVLVNGEPLRGRNKAARVMFQDARLLQWQRVLKNVELGLGKHSRQRAEWALDQVGLRDRSGEWPVVLSGGQRQRVALARALATQPRLLLLDEPLGALDALTRISMQQLIESLWQEQKFTALLVTHDVAEAVALADRVVLLEEGKVAMDLPISLPRPRQQGDAKFAKLVGHVLERVMGEHHSNQEVRELTYT